MRHLIKSLALTALMALPLAAPTTAHSQAALTPEQRTALRAEIRAYLLENPEVIFEAIQILEARRDNDARERDKHVVAQISDELFNDPHSFVGGNPDGDVTVVEFTDYRCPYCKRAHPILKQLVESDPNVRLVIKEFPILGPESVAVGKVAIAAFDIAPDKYEALNDALMSYPGQVTELVTYRIAKEVGIDIAALKERAKSPEVDQYMKETYEVAQSLNLQGTPSFVIGDEVVRGFVELDVMQQSVADARKAVN